MPLPSGEGTAQQELLLPPGTFTGQVRRPIDDTIEELGGAPSIVNVYTIISQIILLLILIPQYNKST